MLLGAAAKRQRVEAECLAIGHCTKSTLANILRTLHARGVLRDDIGEGSTRQVRSRLRATLEHHSKAMTPYGRVVQRLSLPFPKDVLPTWDIAHPFALLYHMSTLSRRFGVLMENAMGGKCEPIPIVLYIDEVVPGNPMRHDKGRTLQAIYWIISAWPQYILKRTEAWFTFAVLQSRIAAQLPGGIAALFPIVLKVFMPEGTPHITLIVHKAKESIAAPLSMHGFISDLKANSELFGVKSTAGTKTCSTCDNCVQFIPAEFAGRILRDMGCADLTDYIQNSDADLYAKADKLLAAEADGADPTRIGALEQELGILLNKNSVLFDQQLRHWFKPVSMNLRDPMHLLVSGGVAGTEMAMIMHELNAVGIQNSIVTKYCSRYTLPRDRGKPCPKWFDKDHVGDHQMRTFASEQLSMIPLLHEFLVEVIQPLGILISHIQCFGLMNRLIGLIQLGPDACMPYIYEIKSLITEHARLFKRLYPDQIRPKFHHLLHIVDNALFIGKMLTCFVLERKHRATKDAARECFRYIEHTVIVDLVNRQCTNAMSKDSALDKMHLLNEMQIHGTDIVSAIGANLPCGNVLKGDVVFYVDASSGNAKVGQVLKFYQHNDRDGRDDDADDRDQDIVVSLLDFKPTRKPDEWQRSSVTIFATVDGIVAPLCWREAGPSVIRVVLPILHRPR
jgi:hypothetical protein